MKKIFFLFSTCFCAQLQAQTVVNSGMFGMMEARQLGPGTMSGRITSIVGVPNDTKIIYVGTAGGGVWKSSNAGTTYKSIFDKYCQSIGAIGISPKNPATVYVGTGESNMRNSVSIGNGMYKSTDAGDNWKAIGLDSTEHISKIIVHPTNDQIVYVAVPGPLWSDSKHRGLYKSVNGGETWEKILYKNEKTGCAELLMDPKDPNILFASMWQFRRQPFSFNSGGEGSGLFKSTDGGITWKEITNGLPAKPFGRIAMTLAPSDPKKMWAIVESKNTGLYISDDGGESWKSQSASMNVCARPFYFSTIEVDPKDPKRVYRPGFLFAYSEDGGYSFSEASYEGGGLHPDMHALWIHPNNPDVLYLGTDGGLYRSIDKGVTWIFNQNLPVGQFYHVAHDLDKPYHVYGGLQDNGSWMAPSAAPGGISNARWDRLYGGDGFWTIPDIDGQTVYAEYQGGNMSRINRVTMKSEDIQPKQTAQDDDLRWNWNTPLVTGAANSKNLYTGSQYLYKSTNQGRDWTRISGDLTTNNKDKQKQEESGGLSADNTSAENHCTIFTIAESPLDANLVWVGTDDGNLQYTIDGGKTWKNVSANYAQAGIPASTWISSIEPSHFDKNILYATFDNHMYGDHRTYLGKSTDMGATWTRMQQNDFTGFAHKICEDPINKNLLFLGTEMGLFATLDGGAHWFRMKNNIPEYAMVRDIKIHPTTHDLIVGTHGRGIFIVDDITAMRSLTAEVWDKDVYLFPIPDLTLNNGKYGWGGPESAGGWSAGNPPEMPSIDYYLKDRVSTGKVELEIYDAKNTLLQTIPGSKRKGINKVYWNLRGTPPKVASGSTKMDGAGFTAPMVLPGTYTVKLKVKDKEYTSKINCIHDAENKDLSIVDRALVFERAMVLQSLYNNVNTDVDSIQTILTKLKADSNNKTHKQLKTELEKIRSEYMATKQTSMFADEKELREKISELYGTFCGMEAKPNKTQLQAIEALDKKYLEVHDKLQKTLDKFLPKMNL
ncbi:MAG: glycosyl hydrolase [Bacteroidetes bacterium]|nr:glycosyl hydrolase [Bacteroidota bacterium]